MVTLPRSNQRSQQENGYLRRISFFYRSVGYRVPRVYYTLHRVRAQQSIPPRAARAYLAARFPTEFLATVPVPCRQHKGSSPVHRVPYILCFCMNQGMANLRTEVLSVDRNQPTRHPHQHGHIVETTGFTLCCLCVVCVGHTTKLTARTSSYERGTLMDHFFFVLWRFCFRVSHSIGGVLC